MSFDNIVQFFGLKKPESMDIHQLDNLVKNIIPFVFIDLSPKKYWGEKVESLISRAEKMDPKTAVKTIVDRKVDPSQPIVVVCENGKISSAVVLGLSRKGYKNAYVLNGGLQSALSLLEPH